MATGDAYVNPGTEIVFADTGGDVVITLDENVAAADGQKSAAWTLAAAWTTARPTLYYWTAKTFWAAGAVVGETLDLYLAEADSAGNYAGGVTAGDGAFTDEDALQLMTKIGAVSCTNATEEQEYATGWCTIGSNKAVLVAWNSSAAATLHATHANHRVAFTPMPLAVQ